MSIFKDEFNWFFVPNHVVDNETFLQMPPVAAKLLLYLARKTFGFQKKSESFSLRYLERALNVSRPTLILAIKWLEASEILSKSATRTATKFSINTKTTPPEVVKNIDQPPEVVKNLYHSGKKSLPQVVKIFDQIKETEINTFKINTLMGEVFENCKECEKIKRLLEKKSLSGLRALTYALAVMKNEIETFPHRYKIEEKENWREYYKTANTVLIAVESELSETEKTEIENKYKNFVVKYIQPGHNTQTQEQTASAN